MEDIQENREDIIRINGELKLINLKLDNHVTHLTQRVNVISKTMFTIGVMVLVQILIAIREMMYLV